MNGAGGRFRSGAAAAAPGMFHNRPLAFEGLYTSGDMRLRGKQSYPEPDLSYVQKAPHAKARHSDVPADIFCGLPVYVSENRTPRMWPLCPEKQKLGCEVHRLPTHLLW